jgi:hypothetical protein
MSSADGIMSIINMARGERPYSIESFEAEQALTIALALLVELVATNDRLDRVERQLSELTGKTLDDVRQAGGGDAADKERQENNEALMIRALRILIDPRPSVDQRPESRKI